jgi:hypothetical protein
MTDDQHGENATTAVVAASADLLERLNADESPLSVVSASLERLASALGVDRAMVAIDDPDIGRQVFTSGRRMLGDNGDLLWGPPCVRTDPPIPLDPTLSRLIIAAVMTTFERAQAIRDSFTGPDALVNAIKAAVDRSARYGWGFTLVLIRADEAEGHAPSEVEAHLRVGDTVMELGPRDLAILLPNASDTEVPSILSRAGQHGAVSTFCYGLATCPGDADDAEALLNLAAARLRDAVSSRSESEVHAIEAPTV